MHTETPHIDHPQIHTCTHPPRIVHPETDTLINSSFGTRYGTSISGVEIHTPQFGTRKYVQIHTIHTGIHTKRHNMTQNDTYSHRIPHKYTQIHTFYTHLHTNCHIFGWVTKNHTYIYISIYIYNKIIHSFIQSSSIFNSTTQTTPHNTDHHRKKILQSKN